MPTENHFKKFLIDEITRLTNASITMAIDEVNNFSKTQEFKESYKKWIKVNSRMKPQDTIKHISECFK